jgi:putative ABC transport system ATP-binding protein
MDVTTGQGTEGSNLARVVDATKVYGEGDNAVLALDNVTVGFPAGQFTAVMGPSGSGKSTLMHCLAGLDRLNSGEVWVGDTELGSLSERDLTLLRRTDLGFIFQAFNLLPMLNATENIMLPLNIAGRKAEQSWYERVIDTIGLRHRLDHQPAGLSGGEQQRIAGARALVSRPKLVVADEPTGNLDSKSSAELLGFMRRSVDEFGQTIVMVTHDPHAAAYADRILLFGDGRVIDEMLYPTVDRVLDYMKRLDYRPRHEAPEPKGNGHLTPENVDQVLFLADGEVVDEMLQPSADKVFTYLKRRDYRGLHEQYEPDEYEYAGNGNGHRVPVGSVNGGRG